MENDKNLKILKSILLFLKTGIKNELMQNLEKNKSADIITNIYSEISGQNSKRKLYNLLKYSNIGTKFKTRTFDKYITNLNNEYSYKMSLKYASTFDLEKLKGKGIFFYGNYCVGKTHLACSIANVLIHNNISVIFGSFIKLMSNIKDTYNTVTTDNEKHIIDSYTNCDLLIIDDLGKERLSEWNLEKLYYIINERYENNKPIVITSNFSYKELTSRLSLNKNISTAESLISRINEMCIILHIKGEDYRTKI